MALTKIPGNLIQTGAITAAALDDDAVKAAARTANENA